MGILLTVIGLAGFFADAHFDATHQESFIGLFEVNGWANPRHDDHAAGTGRGF